jgi:hypothetical protein
MTDLSRKVFAGYVLAGAVLGALWVAQSGAPLWEHGLRLLLLIAGVTAATTLLRKWRGRDHQHDVTRFIAAKVGLVVVAMLATVLLDDWLGNPDPWVGLGLFVVVAVLGPVARPWLAPARAAEVTR